MYTRQKGKYLIKFRVCLSTWRICRWGMTIRKFSAFHHIGKCFDDDDGVVLGETSDTFYVSAWLFIIHSVRNREKYICKFISSCDRIFLQIKKWEFIWKFYCDSFYPCVDNLWNMNGVPNTDSPLTIPFACLNGIVIPSDDAFSPTNCSSFHISTSFVVLCYNMRVLLFLKP